MDLEVGQASSSKAAASGEVSCPGKETLIYSNKGERTAVACHRGTWEFGVLRCITTCPHLVLGVPFLLYQGPDLSLGDLSRPRSVSFAVLPPVSLTPGPASHYLCLTQSSERDAPVYQRLSHATGHPRWSPHCHLAGKGCSRLPREGCS